MERKTFMLTDEQRVRREAQTRLAEEVRSMLHQNERERLHWTGTTTDLMEALHVAFDTGLLTNDEGDPMSFMQIVRQACRILHHRMPGNPYDAAMRGTRRKGVLRHNYADRYCYLLGTGHEQPFFDCIV
jgi:hypothetical protein